MNMNPTCALLGSPGLYLYEALPMSSVHQGMSPASGKKKSCELADLAVQELPVQHAFMHPLDVQ